MTATSLRQLSVVLFLALAVVACGPVKLERTEEVKPNETAFVIPLEYMTKDGQKSFSSIEFLESHKVAAKRIILSQRQRDTGRMPWDYEWIATDLVIKVDRAPVTREWTETPHTGTSAKNDALSVESLDSINFSLGATITCSVIEENTATFLYFYAGKQLDEIVDTNIRSYVQMVVAREFGKIDLTEGMKRKAEIFTLAFTETRDFFGKKGITVDFLGSTHGLHYANDNIQAAIDKKFVAERDIETARQEQFAQETRNATLVAKAQAEADAAKKLGEASEAVTMKTDLEIRRIQAEAMKTAADRWNGSMPSNILPQGTNILFGLDQARPQK